MLFVVTEPVAFVSSELRGKHIADALGCKVLVKSIGNAQDEPIVFVKDAPRDLVEKAKERGNRILYDPLDMYCYMGRKCSFAELVDVVIVPNAAAAGFYASKGFEFARYAVIPHQWDYRITGEAPQDRVRPAYIGHEFNCPKGWDGTKLTLMTADVLGHISGYNLHLSLNSREPTHVLLKPAIKVASAAAVGANVVAFPDPSALELLGPDYPFYVHINQRAAIRMACEAFGGPEWKRGLEKMKEVRERTSLRAIAALYRRLGEGDEALLIDAPTAEAA